MSEDQAQEPNVSLDDQELLKQLISINQINLAQNIVIDADKSVLGDVVTTGAGWPTTGIELHIDPNALDSHSDKVVDAILDDAEKLIDEGEVLEGFGHLTDGLRRVWRSLVDRHLSTDSVVRKLDRVRNITGKAALKMGAHEYTVELSIGLSSGIALALHFKAQETA